MLILLTLYYRYGRTPVILKQGLIKRKNDPILVTYLTP